MHHVMFDIDGTLLQSYDFDSDCFVDAVKEVTGINVETNWSNYTHVTDSGILSEIIDSNTIPQQGEIHEQVKCVFVRKIEQSIKQNPVKEIPGAASFLALLDSMDDVVVSFATGGWYESAVLKLRSAGIDFSGIPIASANDHFARTEIMIIADSRATGNRELPWTYFGDGAWDKKACEQLGINFVLVGDKVDHHQKIENFQSVDEAMTYIGL